MIGSPNLINNIAFWNINNFNSSIYELQHPTSKNIDLLFISETWLNKKQIFPQLTYFNQLCRFDYEGPTNLKYRNMRGFLVLLNKKICINTNKFKIKSDSNYYLHMEINSTSFYFIYYPPHLTHSKILEITNTLNINKNNKNIVFGDLNINSISENKKFDFIKILFEEFNKVYIPKKYYDNITYLSKNTSSNIDNLFCSHEISNNLLELKTENHFSSSDHLLISFKYNIKQQNSPFKKYSFKTFNRHKIKTSSTELKNDSSEYLKILLHKSFQKMILIEQKPPNKITQKDIDDLETFTNNAVKQTIVKLFGNRKPFNFKYDNFFTEEILQLKTSKTPLLKRL